MTDLYLPGSALGGALLDGWTGPVDEWVPPGAASFSGHWGHSVCLDGKPYPDRYRVTVNIRLNPRREEVAARVARVLRSLGHEIGHLLPLALGGRVGDGVEETVCSACGGDGRRKAPNLDDEPCPFCAGAGKSRRPVPAADRSARLLVASVAGVEAGRGVVRCSCR